MISKKRRHKGLIYKPPTTGRAAFKGFYHPLILGGQSVSSSMTGTTNFDPYSQATITPAGKGGETRPIEKEPCELTIEEKRYCDVNPTFRFCDKKNMTSDDPKCVATDIKCPLTQQWLDRFSSTDPSDQFGLTSQFLGLDGILNGVNGQCIDEYIKTRTKCARVYFLKEQTKVSMFCPITSDNKGFIQMAEKRPDLYRVEYFYP